MELAIPLVIGGLLYASNVNKAQPKSYNSKNNNNRLEGFTQNNMSGSKLPNVNIPPVNYPVINKSDLEDTVLQFNANSVDTTLYLNQNVYENDVKNNKKVGNIIPNEYDLGGGNYTDTTTFRHNNMVPFNGGKIHGYQYKLNNTESILDAYSGAGSLNIHKKEQAPLFKPEGQITWGGMGMPNMSNFYESRVNPAMKNSMVKPFESVKVAPALDKGYSSEGFGGFNSGMDARDKYLPKTTDELRVLTNPKQEYSLDGLEGALQSVVKNRGIEGKVEKYRPDTFFINGQDRWFTTTGAEQGYLVNPTEVLKDQSRPDTTVSYTGTTNSVLKTATYAPQNHQPAKKIQLEGTSVNHSNACYATPYDDSHMKKNSILTMPTNRGENCESNWYGTAITGAVGALLNPIMNVIRPTRKEEFDCNVRSWGNLGSKVPQNYVTNSNDKLATTTKETTLYTPHGYVGNQQENGYLVSQMQVNGNQRDTTLCGHVGNAGSMAKGMRNYSAEYNQTTNSNKETTFKTRINQGNAAYFNPTVNMSISKNDEDRMNNRVFVPQGNLITVIPTADQIGYMSGDLTNKVTMNNRMNPELLESFKQNPYVVPVVR